MIVVLVRHAERLSSGDDPALSAAGRQRATILAAMFEAAGVTSIFTSGARRTKETAAPLAARLGLTPSVVDDDTRVATEQILAGGPCVMVVGHSNTVPEFIETLGGPSGVVIDDGEFDRMFVLTVTPPAPASLLSFRYVA
jgi:phosphohistidine phosphatase SixA